MSDEAVGKPLSAKAKKRRKEALVELRERIQAKLRERRSASRMTLPDPPPRYDEVFAQGQAWLDRLAGEPIEPQQGELVFATEVWRMRGGDDSEVP